MDKVARIKELHQKLNQMRELQAKIIESVYFDSERLMHANTNIKAYEEELQILEHEQKQEIMGGC